MFLESMGRGGGGGRGHGRYILRGHTPVPCDDLMAWGEWMGTADRRVAWTPVHGVEVSTVFLGLDHNFFGDGPPLLFESMIFGGSEDGWCMRCPTWQEAELQHQTAMAVARRASRKPSAAQRNARARQALADLRKGRTG